MKINVKILSALSLLILWCVICSCDIAVQWDLRITTFGGWYQILKSGCAVGLSLWAVQFVFGRRIRWLYALLLVWMSIVLVIEWFVRINFNMTIAGDLWLFVAGSSKDETLSFVLQFITWGTAVLLLTWVVCTALGVFVVLHAHYVKVTWQSLLLGLMFLGAACLMGGTVSYDALTKRLICRSIIYDTMDSREKWVALSNALKHPRIPTDFSAKFEASSEPLGVIVVGESATRNHMHLYGYPRDTTPWADSQSLVVFSNLITSAVNTQDALKGVFTDASLDKDEMVTYTLPQVVNKFGYESGLVSNQGKWGIEGTCDSYLAAIFADVKNELYLDSKTNTWPKFDMMLVPYICEMLESKMRRGPAVLFVHLVGSHCAFRHRCPKNEARWNFDYCDQLTELLTRKKRVDVNAYDSSIAYTDMVLSNIVNVVEKMHRPSFVMYFSDHGESPLSSCYRDPNNRDTWEIPMFVWFSLEYRDAYAGTVLRAEKAAGKQLQSDQLTMGILELLHIVKDEDSESFLSENFKIRKHRCVFDGCR